MIIYVLQRHYKNKLVVSSTHVPCLQIKLIVSLVKITKYLVISTRLFFGRFGSKKMRVRYLVLSCYLNKKFYSIPYGIL